MLLRVTHVWSEYTSTDALSRWVVPSTWYSVTGHDTHNPRNEGPVMPYRPSLAV